MQFIASRIKEPLQSIQINEATLHIVHFDRTEFPVYIQMMSAFSNISLILEIDSKNK